MTHFLHQIPNFQSRYSIVVEDDGKVAYAYSLQGASIVADVWLYNQREAPDKPEWDDSNNAPFLNPKGYCKTINFLALTDPKDVQVQWDLAADGMVMSVHLFFRGQRFAQMAPGKKPG